MSTTRHFAAQAAYSVTEEQLKEWIDGYSNGDEEGAKEIAATLYSLSCDVANYPDGSSAEAITFFYRWGRLEEAKAKAKERGDELDFDNRFVWEELIWSAWLTLSASLASSVEE